MKKLAISLVVAGVMILFSASANAGFVDPALNPNAEPFSCDFPNTQNQHQWEFDYNPAAPTLTMNESISSASLDDVLLSGETDEDPIFTVVKTIENDSGISWTGYILTLSGGGGATFVKGSAGAGGNKLQTVNYLHPAAIEFAGTSSIESVEPGELLTLSFDINVPTKGLFNFTLTQEPVPEPATMSLLGLGGLLFFRRRGLRC